MKILVTGVKGQLGYDVVNELNNRGHDVVGVDIEDMDICDSYSVQDTFEKVCPDAVVHCAAWTAVDPAEDENNKGKVYAVNVLGTENIAKECKKLGSKLIYISTDYVFDGQGTRAWTPDDSPSPLNYYGKTKYEGEIAVKRHLDNYFIVRIAWVFGINGKNFIKTMLNVGKTHEMVQVVNDQIGTPTYTYDLARLLADMLVSDKYGIYHATNEGGYISWYDFTCEIYSLAGLRTKIMPVTTAEYGLSDAKRPSNSRMDKSKLAENGFTPLPDWKDALKRYLSEVDRKKISVICACNNTEMFDKMLLPSLKKQTYTNWETIIVNANEKGFKSAAQTLNYGASIATGGILIFVHQDIELKDVNFFAKLLRFCEDYNFGIGGVAGVVGAERQVYSSVTMDYDHRIAGKKIDSPQEVDTIDECCFFVKKEEFKRFEDFGSWHFYAVEYSLRCREAEQKVMIFPLDLYHLSPGWSLDNSYWTTLKKVAKRHKNMKYISTTMGNFKNGLTLPVEILLRKIKNKIEKHEAKQKK